MISTRTRNAEAGSHWRLALRQLHS
eukprot:COSAG01_NODE_25546_length_741_cov_1.183801_3_plen_24_part_01